ncbi:dimethyl sulfoxide reductase anchor subunit [Campylobacter sp. RM10534]|nr:dimethyl sulfoxide reductase anchor subunit [Campylobacter sp. RM10534]
MKFYSLVCIFGFLLYYKNKKWIFFLALLSGILGIFFMSGAYGSMEKSVPTWDFKITLLYFFASAIFLGSILYYCFFEKSKHERKMSFFCRTYRYRAPKYSYCFTNFTCRANLDYGTCKSF